MAKRLTVMVVTGMSGAGRSTALHVLEDLGFFCVDNLPPVLSGSFVKLLEDSSELSRIGFGVDVRTGVFLSGAVSGLEALRERGHEVRVLFFDAADDTLVRRYSATRRPHPLGPDGDLAAAIHAERERLGVIRSQADRVFDTTALTPHGLRRLLVDYVAEGEARPKMRTRLLSFGFKYGIPLDADLVFDVRYLPNPYFEPALKMKTGLDAAVSDFVLTTDDAGELRADLLALLAKLIPKYEREGKSYLTVAIGCTGGRHRSVALAVALADDLAGGGGLAVVHRDVTK